MLRKFLTQLRDWWRGYSAEDIADVRAKFRAARDVKPGEIIPMSFEQMQAMIKERLHPWEFKNQG